MGDIPDDVRVAAKVALLRARLISVLDDQIDIIARAILAERERCASIAENIDPLGHDTKIGMWKAICSAIRSKAQ